MFRFSGLQILFFLLLAGLILAGGFLFVYRTASAPVRMIAASARESDSPSAFLQRVSRHIEKRKKTRDRAPRVPRFRQPDAPVVTRTARIAELTPAEKAQFREMSKININKAGVEDLIRLPRIGPAKAKSIISFREKDGPFLEIHDIVKVSGIGEKTFEKFKDKISVGTVQKPAPVAPPASGRKTLSRPAAVRKEPASRFSGMKPMTCRRCGNRFHVPKNLSYGFCPYCGAKW